MTQIRLGYVIIYVERVLNTVEFYEKAFHLKRRFVDESGQYGELDTGSTVLAFVSEQLIKASHPFRPNRQGDQPAGAEVAFVVDDVEEAFAHAVATGALPAAKPAKKPWGQTVSYVQDNNGFMVEICDEVKGQ